jgi:multidrug efflux pump subunit AcrA (membrane-fusion protein)
MREVALNREKEQRNLSGMQELMESFTITAPEDGMLIYKKDWNGEPVGKGSQISAWDPVVATLPDLSTMISVTYVNEVDIRRVAVGQKVEIGLDAFPDKKFNGNVIKVANVGEQRPNSDAKIFQVNVEIKEKDELLKPSMTTSNRIYTEVLADVMHIPIEALFNENDTITFVYKKTGLSVDKQEVMIGPTNTNEVVILAGLAQGDEVYLNRVEGLEDTEVALIPEMEGKRNIQQPEEEPVQAEKERSSPPGRQRMGK